MLAGFVGVPTLPLKLLMATQINRVLPAATPDGIGML